MNSQNFVYRRLVPKNSNNLDPIHPVLSKPTCFTVLLFQFARKKKKKKPNRQCVYTLTRGNDSPSHPLRPYRECVCVCERLCECVNERPDGKYPPSHYSLSLSQQQQQHKYPPEILSPTFLIFFGKQFRFDFVNWVSFQFHLELFSLHSSIHGIMVSCTFSSFHFHWVSPKFKKNKIKKLGTDMGQPLFCAATLTEGGPDWLD